LPANRIIDRISFSTGHPTSCPPLVTRQKN